MGNLGLLFFLLFFIFAALGVEMFGRLGGSMMDRLEEGNSISAILECGHYDDFKDLYCEGQANV